MAETTNARALHDEWFALGQALWGAETPDPAQLQAFFERLARMNPDTQRAFFMEVAGTHDDAARPDLETGIQLATDFYPYFDDSFFPNFDHLLK